MNTISFVYENENGEEIGVELPAKMVVCSRCDGFGSHLTPSIGEHAYSAEEFYESFPDPEDRAEYFKRGGIYDVQCERCHGRNVEPEVDEKACTTPELKEGLKRYEEHLRQEAAHRREQEAESRWEY